MDVDIDVAVPGFTLLKGNIVTSLIVLHARGSDHKQVNYHRLIQNVLRIVTLIE